MHTGAAKRIETAYANRAVYFFLVCASMLVTLAPTSASALTSDTVVYNFGGPDGAAPISGIVGDSVGDIFGATVFGGTKEIGAIFELTPGSSGYSDRVIYSFLGRNDGDKPTGIVRVANGDIFGFGAIDGTGGGGTVFELSKSKPGYRFRTLYGFPRQYYAWGPVGAPVLGKFGALFGVTQGGDTGNTGTVFKLTPSGHDYAFATIYEFPGGAGGDLPQAGLTSDSNGSIYGTTYYGGNMSGCGGGCGEVFKITPTMTGYRESVLYRFQNQNDGANPYGVLTVDDATGDIYGTTEYGGTGRCGTAFELTPGSNGYTHRILYDLDGQNGCLPEGTIFVGPNGALVGTAALGGRQHFGVVYELTPEMGRFAPRTLYDFRGPTHGVYDGAEPEQTNFIMSATGELYGTTRSHGSQTQCGDGGPCNGCGTVFKIQP